MRTRIHAGKDVTDENIVNRLEDFSFGFIYQYHEYLQKSAHKMEDENT